MLTRKIDLQMIAKVGGFVKFGMAAERFELRRHECAQPVYCRLVIAGRFNLDQLPEDGNDFIFPLFEIL